jgi:hypothetical protein
VGPGTPAGMAVRFVEMCIGIRRLSTRKPADTLSLRALNGAGRYG